ncbi:hypothetical protein PPTG_24805 [Phytophthora nicotianae INRA-310]|uniref:Uncharacterized protein n=1 Tax=Phytophthora nicotianae (strain INRA-310) TaxID=761204 RepID=W2PCC1_PHYN3|nr:hypothetical protein PPTG_24805 [Phytophthora nicotianae INRA-310]ETM97858.1 hypothetical protein PPTG_24805 [Phytophthora nicotianae INRA-310]
MDVLGWTLVSRTYPIVAELLKLLLMTSERDPMTGQEHVLVQRLSVNRYNLPPSSPRLHDEIRSTLPWFNGDLFMEVICRQLEHGSPARTLPSC